MGLNGSVKQDEGNRNYIGKDGLLHSIWVGDQNASSVEKMKKELYRIVKTLRKSKKPILILDDLSRIGKVHLSARQAGYEVIRTLDYDKCAIFGNYLLLGSLVNAVILATGCGFKIKFLSSEEEARDWLVNRYESSKPTDFFSRRLDKR